VSNLQNHGASPTIKTMRKRLAGVAVVLACCLCIILLSPAYADSPSKSTNYELDETVVGGSGLTQESSSNFQAGESIGDTGIGNSASSNFQLNAGYTTTNDPALSFAVDTSTPSFGAFSPSSAATATATFEVSDYTSYGYAVQVVGNPPSNGSHTLPAMSTTGPSQIGVEQFGINVVANTSPITFGSNPNNGQFGNGQAAANYSSANNYRYVNGETIATGPKSSGITIYTISYIVNVTSLTPGGQYASSQTLLCTGTF
jgi:hypothetical protein